MRTFGAVLGVVLLSSCLELIGDRCNAELPPCPNGKSCQDGHCRPVVDGGTDGGMDGGGGGPDGGTTGDAGEDAGALDAGIDAGVDGGVDAGTDAGTDAGFDGGTARDAGRVLVLLDHDLYVQPDGSILEYPATEDVIAAVFILGDAGVVRFPMVTDGGGEFIVENAPLGPWMAEFHPPGSLQAFVDISTDRYDVSSTIYSGRPGFPVSSTRPFAFDLVLQPWGVPGSIDVVSHSSGSRFMFEPTLSAGTISFTQQWLASSVFGPAIMPSDDLVVNQIGSVTLDSGISIDQIVGTARLTGLQAPPDVVRATLVAPTVFSPILVDVDGGLLASALAGAGTSCVLFAEEAGPGGVRIANAPFVAATSTLAGGERHEISVPNPAGTDLTARHICSRGERVPVPFADGGFEGTDAGRYLTTLLIQTTTTSSLAAGGGSGVAAPECGIPSSIAVDGQMQGTTMAQSPVVSWVPPALGSPNRYYIIVKRLSRVGTQFIRSNIAVVYTSQTRVRIPFGVLSRGERYSFQVHAVQSPGFDPRRPLMTSMPSTATGANSAVFAVE